MMDGEPTDDLLIAWSQNRCGDAACEMRRLKAAIRVLTGGKTHHKYAEVIEQLDAPPSTDDQIKALDAKMIEDFRR